MHDHLRSGGGRLGDEVVPVIYRAGNRDEDIAGQHLARIVPDLPAGVALQAVAGNEQLAERFFK